MFLCQVDQLCNIGDDTVNYSGITYGILGSFFCRILPFLFFGSSLRSHFTIVVKAGLGLPDTDAWYTIETIAEKNNIGYKQIVS